MDKEDVLIGACRFCGQAVTVLNRPDVKTIEDANEYASMHCGCPEAAKYQAQRRAEQEREAALKRAQEQIDDLCGGGSVGYGLIPVIQEIRDLMYTVAVLIYDDDLKDVTVNINSCVKVRISKSSKGKIVFMRSDAAVFKQEA